MTENTDTLSGKKKAQTLSDNAYKKYMLGMLLVILAFSYVDRQLLALVLQDIKLEFGLTDSELGFLSGFAFAIFYSVMGIPIARWADRGNRVTIITITTVLWSIAVTLCGAAVNFIQLLILRICVAVGEAGCMPVANSIIPDFFAEEERPRAMAVYMMGASLSVVLAYFVGGWLNEFFGWRWTFVILGVPGVLIGVVAGITLREPRFTRKPSISTYSLPDRIPQKQTPIEHPSITSVVRNLLSNKTYLFLVVAFTFNMFFATGIGLWLPTFFVRSHGMGTGELGTWFALNYGVLSAVGTYCGGELASRFAPNNEQLQFKVMSFVVGLFSIISIGIYLSANKYVALGLMGLSSFIFAGITGPLFAAVQRLMTEKTRAVAIAFFFLVANLFGMGLAPLLAGIISDLLASRFGVDSLRYALMLFSPGYLVMAVFLWLASTTVKDDIGSVAR